MTGTGIHEKNRVAAAAAEWYARRGYGVFPINPTTRLPLFAIGTDVVWAPNRELGGGHKRAVFNPEEARCNWPKRASGIGLVPPLGVAILDFDEKHVSGVVEWAVSRWQDLPLNGFHATRSGGAHVPVAVPPSVTLAQSVNRELGIDVRAGQKGYVVAPPTPGYVVEVPFLHVRRLAPIPEDLLGLLQQNGPDRASEPSAPGRAPSRAHLSRYVWAAIEGEHDVVVRAPDGAKNDTLHKAAVRLGTLVGAGVLARADATDALLAAVGAAPNPLPIAEARRTIESGLGFGIRHPRPIRGDLQ